MKLIIEVVEIKGKCPVYKLGDKIVRHLQGVQEKNLEDTQYVSFGFLEIGGHEIDEAEVLISRIF